MPSHVEDSERNVESARAKITKLEQQLEGADTPAKVEKLEGHLAAAREGLATAEAELVAAREAAETEPEQEHSGEYTYAHAEHASGTGSAGPIG